MAFPKNFLLEALKENTHFTPIAFLREIPSKDKLDCSNNNLEICLVEA